MKHLTKSINILLVLIISGCLSLACEQQANPLHSETNTDYVIESLANSTSSTVGIYPQYGSSISPFWDKKNIYKGTTVNIPNGSNLSLSNGAMTPPPGTFGQDIAITMLVEKDAVNNQLVFTFGPHGCVFDPPVEVEFNWTDLGIDEATLFYIDDNGNYIPQMPASVNVKNKKMMLNIDHFSRYAIGTE